MRRFIMAALIATSAALTGVMPAEAGAYRAAPAQTQYSGGIQLADHYYGHRRYERRHRERRYYKRRHYEPVCFYKRVYRYDSYGNRIVRRIRVCE